MEFDSSAVWSKDAARLDREEMAIVARAMVTAREALNGPLPLELIHDPALDLLLNLFLATINHETRTLADLAKATTVPLPSVTRWVKALIEYGFVEGSVDNLCLSDSGFERMSVTLRAVAASQR